LAQRYSPNGDEIVQPVVALAGALQKLLRDFLSQRMIAAMWQLAARFLERQIQESHRPRVQFHVDPPATEIARNRLAKSADAEIYI
jgi:hypothetical protein